MSDPSWLSEEKGEVVASGVGEGDKEDTQHIEADFTRFSHHCLLLGRDSDKVGH